MTISINGTVAGDLDTVEFTPSLTEFSNAEGDTVVGEPVYALVTNLLPGLSQVSVDLPDRLEMLNVNGWVWMVRETSKLGLVTLFTLPSDPGDFQYADIRPV